MHRDRMRSRDEIDELVQEKRKSARITVKMPLTMELTSEPVPGVDLATGETVSGVTINISSGGLLRMEGEESLGSGGLLVEVDREVVAGMVFSIDLTIPLPGFIGVFVVEGEVLRVSPPDEEFSKPQAAIRFRRIITHRFNNVKLDIIKNMLGLQ